MASAIAAPNHAVTLPSSTLGGRRPRVPVGRACLEERVQLGSADRRPPAPDPDRWKFPPVDAIPDRLGLSFSLGDLGDRQERIWHSLS